MSYRSRLRDDYTPELLVQPLQPSSGRSNPIELVELSSPLNTTNLASLANEPPAIGLSVDPSQTQTLDIFHTERRQFAKSVRCRRRARHYPGDQFPDHASETAFELSTRSG